MQYSRRRTLLAISLCPALLATGCAVTSGDQGTKSAPIRSAKEKSAGSTKAPAPKKPAEPTLPKIVDDGGMAPRFLPAVRNAPSRSLDQQIRIRFLPKAVEAGAPDSVPTLRALVVTDPSGVNAVFTAMGMTVWTFKWDGVKIDESRSPRLPHEVDARKLLRDLTFTLWPAEHVKSALTSDLAMEVRRGEKRETRVLRRNGKPILGALIEKRAKGSVITIENAIEGYALTIESAS
ncbi:DUF3261 domain-containing protein [Sutterella sp.]|uniref:DUF3261 domain-containing protein n=1 Tax=Sutterella sp. TaxID=1981025 RepID=UPI0026DEF15F|nr:DUF3261 domain-containing protein [Sutterella sp.]MDO5532314.1 DUF3261 domain-containing protein [Sutterella sp.]